jgi:hypothetical protein
VRRKTFSGDMPALPVARLRGPGGTGTRVDPWAVAISLGGATIRAFRRVARQEDPAVTPTEMETLLRNLDTRLLHVEQILPTLATKTDLAELRTDLSLQIQRSANQLRVLIEANRSENQLLAEHVSEILARLRDDR